MKKLTIPFPLIFLYLRLWTSRELKLNYDMGYEEEARLEEKRKSECARYFDFLRVIKDDELNIARGRLADRVLNSSITNDRVRGFLVNETIKIRQSRNKGYSKILRWRKDSDEFRRRMANAEWKRKYGNDAPRRVRDFRWPERQTPSVRKFFDLINATDFWVTATANYPLAECFEGYDDKKLKGLVEKCG